MFKEQTKTIPIKRDKVVDFNATLDICNSKGVDTSFFAFGLGFDSGTDNPYSFAYKEVESTGLQIPIQFESLFWLDVESGYVFYARFSNVFFVPLFNLKEFIVYYGIQWDKFLDAAIKNFSPNYGINLENYASKILHSSLGEDSYDFSKSLSYNFLQLSPTIKDRFDLVSVSDKLTAFFQMFGEYGDKFEALNPTGVLGSKQLFQPTGIRNLHFELLENSFQSPLMKDFMEALAGETHHDTIVAKLESEGILDTLKSDYKSFGNFRLSAFFSGQSEYQPRELSFHAVFPVDILMNQISKLVRRLKIKGIV